MLEMRFLDNTGKKNKRVNHRQPFLPGSRRVLS